MATIVMQSIANQDNANPENAFAQSIPDTVTMCRRAAYQQEADGLFFKAQRGEATLGEWQAKVAEIKARYPKAGA
jgi:hypothetical protein